MQHADAFTLELDQLVGEAAPIGGTTAPTTLTSISEWLDKLWRRPSTERTARRRPTILRGFAVVSGALDAIEPRWRRFEAAGAAASPGPR